MLSRSVLVLCAFTASFLAPGSAIASERTLVCKYEKHPAVFLGESIMRPRGKHTYVIGKNGTAKHKNRVMNGRISETRIDLFDTYEQKSKEGVPLTYKHTVMIDLSSGQYSRFSQIIKRKKIIYNEIVDGQCFSA